jgi:hypothetical protein
MGWRDINTNRRKPPVPLALIPAVLRKSSLAALSGLFGIRATAPGQASFVVG